MGKGSDLLPPVSGRTDVLINLMKNPSKRSVCTKEYETPSLVGTKVAGLMFWGAVLK